MGLYGCGVATPVHMRRGDRLAPELRGLIFRQWRQPGENARAGEGRKPKYIDRDEIEARRAPHGVGRHGAAHGFVVEKRDGETLSERRFGRLIFPMQGDRKRIGRCGDPYERGVGPCGCGGQQRRSGDRKHPEHVEGEMTNHRNIIPTGASGR